MVISPEAARAYLERDRDANLMPLGALAYDPVRAHVGAERDGALVATALVVELAANLPDGRPTVMVSADDGDAVERLMRDRLWPPEAIWTSSQPETVRELERLLGKRRSQRRGLRYYIGAVARAEPPGVVRPITPADADDLDLSPCALSPTALRNWLRRGWRIFGVVQGHALVCHALAAYPIGDTEEVSAVFTAPRWRRRGLARAAVAATVRDIVGRGRRAVYVAGRSNTASQGVAAGVGLELLHESWEIVTG
jgi:hypothetical protein